MIRKARQPVLLALSLAAAMLCTPAHLIAMPAKDDHPSRFAALAWASEYMNYAISANLPTREEAEEKALAACRAQVGKDCAIAATSENGVIVLAVADDGGRVAFAEATQALAVNTAMDQCRKKGLRCTYVDSSANVMKNETIRLGKHKMAAPDLWGTFAYREDMFPAAVKRIWAVSEKPSQEEAVLSALMLCQREEQATCVAKAGVRNSYIAAYSFKFDSGTPFVESDVSEVLLKEAITARCRRTTNVGCVTHFMFDVRSPVKPKHDIEGLFGPLPNRPFPGPGQQAKPPQ
jgi:Domain of unknown function (DUF4189)